MKLLQLLTTAALALCVDARDRLTFTSNGTQIVGYHYAPSSQSGPVPGIVIAHGLGGLQSSRLQPYAERFASAGYHAMHFDYRYWGESAGQPRNIIDAPSQQDDYEAAIAFLQSYPGVDPSRLVIWGTSLSGGHVLQLAPKRQDLAAVICQVPHVNGFATSAQLPYADIPAKVAAGTDDTARAALGQPPLYIPTANNTHTYGALTQAGALEGYQFIQPNPPAPGNVFPARFILQLPFFSPDQTAADSKLPTYIAVGLTDNIVSPPATLDLAKRMPNVTLHQFPTAGHFDVYPRKFAYEENVAAMLAFLQKNVPI